MAKKQEKKLRSQNNHGRSALTAADLTRGASGSGRPAWSRLILLFLASFFLHTILNIMVHKSPTVVIDEGLYTNIARSLAWDGTLAFRGQPVNYPYLFYPFLLVPLYWLNRVFGGDIFRIVQVFNTLLITSTVFPACLFASDFTKDQKKSFTAAVIVSLMPDMIMGGYEMTECLIWPLTFWMLFFGYRFFSGGQLRYGLLTSLFTGLLFATKPGAVAAGAVLLLGHFILSVRNKQYIRESVLSLLLLIAVIGLVYGIFRLLFGSSDSILGLYTKQTEEWKPGDSLVALEAVFLLIFFFIFACGGIYGVFPLAHFRDFEKSKRSFILVLMLGIFTVIIGTAIFVVPYKWTGELGNLHIHFRYCSMFVPLMYIFSIDRYLETRKNKGFLIAMAVFVILSFFPGIRAGFVTGTSGAIDSVTLDAFINSRNLNGSVTGWILTVLVAAFSLAVIYYARKPVPAKKRKDPGADAAARAGTVFFILFLLFNSVCALVSANIYIDPTIADDALEINQKISGQKCLGITQRYYDDIYSYWLDSRLNTPMQQVTIDQMFIQMENTDGVYRPFVPAAQAPNVNNHETPETDTLVLGMTISDHLELNKSVAFQTTKNGHFTIAKIMPGYRWVDTMMYGLDDQSLYPGNPGYIHVFDDHRNIGGSIILNITAYGNGILAVDGQEITVQPKAETYEIVLPFKKVISVQAKGGPVQILQYTTREE